MKVNSKFTLKSCKEKILFLDLYSSLSNEKLYINLHIKAMCCHQYRKCMLSHPDHTNKSLVYSQVLRLSRLCSFKEDKT